MLGDKTTFYFKTLHILKEIERDVNSKVFDKLLIDCTGAVRAHSEALILED